MVPDTPNLLDRLLPDRHPQADFFICDVADAVLKDLIPQMEHPFYVLSKKPETAVRRYEHNGKWLEVIPSAKGQATIYDKDILIYCVSQLMAALNAGRAISRTLHLTAHDLLVATNRETSGDAYARLREAFERLAGTRITTNIVTGGTETTSGFGLIEAWEILRRARGGRMTQVRVTLSEWLFRAVQAKSVLTLSRDYFSLRKPLERRVYELARKHCGRQAEWKVTVATLHKKTGSAAPLRVFRAALRRMAADANLPDYRLTEAPGDVMVFNRLRVRSVTGPVLGAEALERARALAPGWDVHALEADWRAWWQDTGSPRLGNADAAFLGWVKARVKK